MTTTQRRNALVIGGSSDIAKALILRISDDATVEHVYVVSRSSVSADFNKPNIHWIQLDSTEENEVANAVARWSEESIRFGLIVSTVGILHTDVVQPEKKLEDLNASAFREVMQINCSVNAIWLQHAAKLIDRTQCQWVAFSARVGSISDNQLGGWYSYRASKAALNMIMKTASIEFARRFKNASIVCYHPGTVDTQLSKPFQANVKPGKLFTPDFTASQLLTHLSQLDSSRNLHYIDWDGKTIPW